MKTSEDFRRALGQPDAGFDQAIQLALSSLPRRKPVCTKRQGAAWVAAAVLAVALLAVLIAGPLTARRDQTVMPMNEGSTGAVFTLREALIESGRALSPEAEALLASSARTGYIQTAHAGFTVEAVHDGAMIHDLYQIRARQEGYLLLDAQWDEEKNGCEDLDMPVSAFFHALEDEEGSVYDYARRNGLKLLLVQCWDQTELTDRVFIGSNWYRQHAADMVRAGGTINCNTTSETILAKYGCVEWVVTADGQLESREEGEISLMLLAGAPLAIARSTAPVAYDQLGVTARLLEARCTALGTYARLDYAEAPAEKNATPDLSLGVQKAQGTVTYPGENGELPQAVIVSTETIPCPETAGLTFSRGRVQEKQEIPLVIVPPAGAALRDAMMKCGCTLSPEAEALLMENARGGYAEMSHARFTVQAVHDGAMLHTLALMEAKEAGYLVLETVWNKAEQTFYELDRPIREQAGFENEEGTLREYAQRKGLKFLLVMCYPQTYGQARMAWDWRRQGADAVEYGTAESCLTGDPILRQTFVCREWVVSADGVLEAEEAREIVMELPAGNPVTMTRCEKETPYDSLAVTVQRVEARSTLLGSFVQVIYSGADADGVTPSLRHLEGSDVHMNAQKITGMNHTVAWFIILEDAACPDVVELEFAGDALREEREIRMVPPEETKRGFGA